jgi:hypothetical protein
MAIEATVARIISPHKHLKDQLKLRLGTGLAIIDIK